MGKYSELMSRAFSIEETERFMDIESKLNDMECELDSMMDSAVSRILYSDSERGEYLLRRAK